MDNSALALKVEAAIFPKEIAHAKLTLSEKPAFSRQCDLAIECKVVKPFAAQAAGEAEQNASPDFEG